MEELIIRSLQGTLHQVDEKRLRIWREASIANERQYQEAAELWKLTGAISERHVSEPRGTPRILELATRSTRPAPPPARTGRPVAYASAAAAVLALAWGLRALSPTSGPTEALGAAEFVTGPAHQVTAKLSDGSVIRLGPQSRVRTGSSSETRDVWLDGQAFFAVAEDSERPFMVRTRLGDARVLGTRFEVKVDPSSMRVVVAEGRVALAAGEDVVSVGEGEMSEARESGLTRVVVPVDVDTLLTWMGHFLVFQATPLRVVAEEIERSYGVRVRLADGALGESTVTAWFSDERLEEVVDVVCRIVDAHCAIEGATVNITP